MDPVLEVDASFPKLPGFGLKPAEECHEALSVPASPPQTGILGYQLDGGAGVRLDEALDKSVPSGFAFSSVALNGVEGTASLIEISVESDVDETLISRLLCSARHSPFS